MDSSQNASGQENVVKVDNIGPRATSKHITGSSLTGDVISGGNEDSTNVVLVAQTLREAFEAESLARDNPPKLPGTTRLFFGGKSEEQTDNDSKFNADLFFHNLETQKLGRTLLLASRLPSTHTFLSENFKSFPVGTTSVADLQYLGRGRGGNSWQSPAGCLMFSFTLTETNGATLPFLQYVVSLAIAQAVEVVSFSKGLKSPLEVGIKWPNDLYSRGMKIGGVLCTSTYSEKAFKIVIGCGLNVSNEEPTTCLNTLLREELPDASPITREELLAEIMGRFEHLHCSFVKSGFRDLEEPYIKRWLHTGQKVKLEEGSDGKTSIVELTIKGLTPGGYLLAVDSQGEEFELHPDGNSFDFFKGLLRRKLPTV